MEGYIPIVLVLEFVLSQLPIEEGWKVLLRELKSFFFLIVKFIKLVNILQVILLLLIGILLQIKNGQSPNVLDLTDSREKLFCLPFDLIIKILFGSFSIIPDIANDIQTNSYNNDTTTTYCLLLLLLLCVFFLFFKYMVKFLMIIFELIDSSYNLKGIIRQLRNPAPIIVLEGEPNENEPEELLQGNYNYCRHFFKKSLQILDTSFGILDLGFELYSRLKELQVLLPSSGTSSTGEKCWRKAYNLLNKLTQLYNKFMKLLQMIKWIIRFVRDF